MKAAHALHLMLGLGAVFSATALISTSLPPSDPISESEGKLKKLAMAVDTFVVDTGKLPPDLGALIVAETVGWRGPYARGGDLIDPWGDPIRYQVAPGTAPGYRLVCVCRGQSIALSN